MSETVVGEEMGESGADEGAIVEWREWLLIS